MTDSQYFDALARLLEDNPPPAADAPVLAALARIGITPGKPFDASQLDPTVREGLEGSVSLALQKLEAATIQMGAADPNNSSNHWRVPPLSVGNFGANYRLRAVIALIAFGANLPADAVYPTTAVDGEGNPLVGSNRYALHFNKDQMPPVNAFWSGCLRLKATST